ncbi:MAG: BNR-4 repeat-containing protein [Tepidisphaeraceae bacterium]
MAERVRKSVVIARAALAMLGVAATVYADGPATTRPATVDGYRGLWFTLGQFSQYGDKYSGGLGTYTSNHVPVAVYAEKVNQTFFVYGGTTAANEKHLLCMAGVFDHASGRVSKPVIVCDKAGVDDPHDNPSINIDADGYVYVFVSGRAKKRPGLKFRSMRPYDVSSFELIEEIEMTYPQIHAMPGGGFFLLFTKYTGGRELYWQTSDDGRKWSTVNKLAGMGGHYQVSNVRPDGVLGDALMYHPGGNVDKRTNLYYVQTADRGKTWTTVDGKPVATPMTDPHGPSLLIDYEKQGLNVYIHDLNFDTAGRPVILYTTSRSAVPGPDGAPFTWRITHWDGTAWQTHDVTTSDHCYDAGSLYIEGDNWRIIGPTGEGPQKWAAGGEISLWTSQDAGRTWRHAKQITTGSAVNHSYARRPRNARDPFYSFWADGDPSKFSPSQLYFTNRAGDKVWQLPYDMTDAWATPSEIGARLIKAK